ncbi:MAG TPA: RNA polymerase sigma factor RpoH [Usitatibacter sp.]|jgi:RNA polymerase sigma-32 factor|nr:RNA polymerase sigma factor RpoH [Usitatibacter sp.]
MTLPATLPPVSSLESYIQAVNAVPMLTQERETDLGRRLAHQGDLTAARDMVLSHLRLVVSVARNYMGYGLPQADLIQEGNVGLMKAVKRFDPERGVRLASFAIHWIKAEIHEYILRNWRMVKIATTKAQRKLFFNLRSMKTSTAALTPTEITQVAETLNVKESDVIEMEQRIQGGDIAFDPLPEDGEEVASPMAFMADPGEGPAEEYEREQSESLNTEGLTRALDRLDERSRRIIQARWLADGDTKTLHELADEFGVSAERIRQIEAKAMQKMKKEMATLH